MLGLFSRLREALRRILLRRPVRGAVAAERALALAREALGPRHPDTFGRIHDLAVLYAAQGPRDEAEALLREALEGWRAALGPRHPDTLATMDHLAGLCAAQGRHAEAELLLHEVLQGRRDTLGPDHPRTLASANNLALLHQMQGRPGPPPDDAAARVQAPHAKSCEAHDRGARTEAVAPAGEAPDTLGRMHAAPPSRRSPVSDASAADSRPAAPQLFISYASADLGRAAALHARLEAAGFAVWFDKARLRPGCDWHREIEAGCEAARVVLPLLTPRWKRSEWTRFETYGHTPRSCRCWPRGRRRTSSPRR